MKFKDVITEGFDQKIKKSGLSADDKKGLSGWYKTMMTQQSAGNKKGAADTKMNIIDKAMKSGLSKEEAHALFA